MYVATSSKPAFDRLVFNELMLRLFFPPTFTPRRSATTTFGLLLVGLGMHLVGESDETQLVHLALPKKCSWRASRPRSGRNENSPALQRWVRRQPTKPEPAKRATEFPLQPV